MQLPFRRASIAAAHIAKFLAFLEVGMHIDLLTFYL
jgi:hypothetical protein